MAGEGKYVYCIVKENKKKNFGYIGINNRQVNTVPYKDMAAAVSSTPVIKFDRLNKKELTNQVAIHQKVNEVLMQDYDVVPVAFGIIAPSVSEVSRILERAYLQFKTALKKIEGKAEFVVQVWWNPKKLLEELANENSEIQKLKKELFLKRGVLRMPIKLRLGKLIQQEMETRRQAFINDIQQILNSLAYDFTQNKLIGDACPVGSRRLSFEDMIANFSFLIERDKESELDRKMQELGKKYEGKLKFKYIGPMPPYSFVNINLSLGNFELVNEARKLLGLPEIATFNEIKKAYYELSHQYHPDKLKGDEEQMKKIAQAYSILENYCQGCDEFLPANRQGMGNVKGQEYSFKEKDVKDTILIG